MKPCSVVSRSELPCSMTPSYVDNSPAWYCEPGKGWLTLTGLLELKARDMVGDSLLLEKGPGGATIQGYAEKRTKVRQ